MDIVEVKISAENTAQADVILDALLAKKLVTGGQIVVAPARFLWKGEVVTMDAYVTIVSYTVAENKESIVNSVRATSAEEVPMITFSDFHDVNSELRDWIRGTLT